MGTYSIGVGTREVTPPQTMLAEGKIYLWGFGGRSEPARTVRDPIWSRALAIQAEGGPCLVLVSLDVCALHPAFTSAVRARVGASRGVAPEYVAINVSHTHSAPVTAAFPSWNPGVDRPYAPYMEFLQNQVVASIEEALDHRQAATLSFARGTSAIGRNRHFDGGAYDRTLDVLHAKTLAGETIAVAFFHGCHPVILQDNDISSDYPGPAREAVERFAGGVALFFQGYGGTIDPAIATLEATGERLGSDVVTLLRGPMDTLSGPVEARTSTFSLPLRPISDDTLHAARDSSETHIRRWGADLLSRGPGVPGALPVELQAVRVGAAPAAWHLMASAHEVVAELAEPVRAVCPYDRVTLMGYTNAQTSYLPTRKVMAEPACPFPFCTGINYDGGESFVWYGHRSPVTEDVDERFVGANVRLLDRGWTSIGGAREVVGMTALEGRLYAATRDGRLWWREAAGGDAPWTLLGLAKEVVGMAALPGTLFCATANGRLWRRPPEGVGLEWRGIGQAQEVAGMTAAQGKLFAATRRGQLWRRAPVDADEVLWDLVGGAEGVVGLAAVQGRLIAATRSGELRWRDAAGGDLPWRRFGAAPGVVAMAALGDVLFAATRDGVLQRRVL